jgi:hypothetical protein
VPDPADIQEVINRHIKSFRTQHGFIDARVPGILASAGLGSAAINVIIDGVNKVEQVRQKAKARATEAY